MKKLKPITEEYLKNYAIFYLEKFDNSSAGLRKVLKRQVYKKAMLLNEYPESHYETVDKVVDYCISKNYINDQRYSENLINRYKNKGFSEKKIVVKLQEKGIKKDIYDSYINDNLDELEQCLEFIQKKKLGCFATNELPIEKQMGRLARNGFSYEVSKKVLYLSKEEVSALLDETSRSGFSF